MATRLNTPSRSMLLSAVAGKDLGRNIPAHLKREHGWVPNAPGSGSSKRQKKRKKR